MGPTVVTKERMAVTTGKTGHRAFGNYPHYLCKLWQTQNYSQTKSSLKPWLEWLSGLSTGLQSKGSLVRFPVRAHAWVVGQIPSREHMRGNHTLMFLSLSFSLPSPLKVNKILENKETFLKSSFKLLKNLKGVTYFKNSSEWKIRL